jgi:hypothetical protein
MAPECRINSLQTTLKKCTYFSALAVTVCPCSCPYDLGAILPSSARQKRALPESPAKASSSVPVIHAWAPSRRISANSAARLSASRWAVTSSRRIGLFLLPFRQQVGTGQDEAEQRSSFSCRAASRRECLRAMLDEQIDRCGPSAFALPRDLAPHR